MRRLLSLAALAALAVPPIIAAYLKQTRPSRGGETSDDLDLVTIFEGRELRSRATSFRGGEVLCWYGGGLVDLTRATLDPAGAYLKATCLFGGFELRVPNDWHVDLRSSSVMGGIGDARPTAGAAPEGAPTLVVDAFCIFGGIGVTGPRPDDGREPVAAVA